MLYNHTSFRIFIIISIIMQTVIFLEKYTLMWFTVRGSFSYKFSTKRKS